MGAFFRRYRSQLRTVLSLFCRAVVCILAFGFIVVLSGGGLHLSEEVLLKRYVMPRNMKSRNAFEV